MKSSISEFAHVKSGLEFNNLLAKNGVSARSLVSTVVKDTVDPGIVVVGSIPKGFAKPESDIDLLVITEREADHLPGSPTLVLKAGANSRTYMHKVSLNGIEIDVEAISLETLSELKTSVGSLYRFFTTQSSSEPIPELSQEDVRLIDMLRHGWAISGEQQIDLFKSSFKADLLPIYFAVYNTIQMLEYFEDVLSLKNEDPATLCGIVRICMVRAAMAFLGAGGITDQNEKWTWKHLNRVASKLDPVGQALIEQIVHHAFLSIRDIQDRDQLVTSIDGIRQKVEGYLCLNPMVKGTLASVRSKFTYSFD